MPYPLRPKDTQRLAAAEALLQSSKSSRRLHALNCAELGEIIIFELEKFLSSRRRGELPKPGWYPKWTKQGINFGNKTLQNITKLASEEIQNSPLEIDLSESTQSTPNSYAFKYDKVKEGHSFSNDSNETRSLVVSPETEIYINEEMNKFLKYYFVKGVDLGNLDKIVNMYHAKQRRENREKSKAVLKDLKKLHIRDKI